MRQLMALSMESKANLYDEVAADRRRLRRWLLWFDARTKANDPKPYPVALLRAEIKSALRGLTVQQYVRRGCVPMDVRTALRGTKPPWKLGVGNQQP